MLKRFWWVFSASLCLCCVLFLNFGNWLFTSVYWGRVLFFNSQCTSTYTSMYNCLLGHHVVPHLMINSSVSMCCILLVVSCSIMPTELWAESEHCVLFQPLLKHCDSPCHYRRSLSKCTTIISAVTVDGSVPWKIQIIQHALETTWFFTSMTQTWQKAATS